GARAPRVGGPTARLPGDAGSRGSPTRRGPPPPPHVLQRLHGVRRGGDAGRHRGAAICPGAGPPRSADHARPPPQGRSSMSSITSLLPVLSLGLLIKVTLVLVVGAVLAV